MSIVSSGSDQPPANPAVLKHAEQRANSLQNRAADKITTFSGSMAFVYLHIVWFVVWIVFGTIIGFDSYPFGLLTMIVSLEAIFLSTFVMISQNRADAKRQVIVDHQWQLVQDEDKQNLRLLELSQQILELTKAVHHTTCIHPESNRTTVPAATGSADGRH
jgi:uncharacterized membrane protein